MVRAEVRAAVTGADAIRREPPRRARVPCVVVTSLPETSAPLVARTVWLDVAQAAVLLDLLPDDSPVCWLRHGEGLVGWGEAAIVRTSGPDRFAEAFYRAQGLSEVADYLARAGASPSARVA